MDIQALADKFWEEGYLVLEDFFTPPLMDHLNDVSLKHFGLNPDWGHNDEFLSRSATEVVPWFPFREGNTDFDVVEKDLVLQELTEAILGHSWNKLYCMVMFSKQGTKGQAWHQDCPPENAKQFNLNRLIYTHDINEVSGGQTIVMPKSHKIGVLPQGEPHEDIEGQVVLTPRKGTLVLLHGHTWHRVLEVNGVYRLSVNSRTIPADTPENITDIAVYRNMRYKFSTNEVIEERL
ncbi:MAG: phytanoyl-CoA dioxygenase family protein [Bacteroidia bacterium]|nr:phytanoyl-CoA dioxygenase family protein [Bacteroidia bacterium]